MSHHGWTPLKTVKAKGKQESSVSIVSYCIVQYLLYFRSPPMGKIRRARGLRAQGAADALFPDAIPRRGTALGRPPDSLFALARTGHGPPRRTILGTVVRKKNKNDAFGQHLDTNMPKITQGRHCNVIARTGDGPRRRTCLAKIGRFGLSGCRLATTHRPPPVLAIVEQMRNNRHGDGTFWFVLFSINEFDTTHARVTARVHLSTDSRCSR